MENKDDFYQDLINNYVMIRTYSAGVHYGILSAVRETSAGVLVKLKNSRRVYSWEGACSLSQLGIEGSKTPSNCKIAIEIPLIHLIAIEIIYMTKVAVDNLKTSVWKS